MHIIVKNGNLTLGGVVANEIDKNLANCSGEQRAWVFSLQFTSREIVIGAPSEVPDSSVKNLRDTASQQSSLVIGREVSKLCAKSGCKLPGT